MLTTLINNDTAVDRPRKRTGTPTQNSYFKREDLGSRGSIVFARHFNDILGQFREIKSEGDITSIDDDTLLHRRISKHVSNLDLDRDADMTDLTDISAYNLQTDEGDFLYKNPNGTISYVEVDRKERTFPKLSWSVMYKKPFTNREANTVKLGDRRGELINSPFGASDIYRQEFVQIITWDHHNSRFGNNEPRNRYHIISYSSLVAGDRFRIGSQTANAYTEFWLESGRFQVMMVNWRSAPVISQYRLL